MEMYVMEYLQNRVVIEFYGKYETMIKVYFLKGFILLGNIYTLNPVRTINVLYS